MTLARLVLASGTPRLTRRQMLALAGGTAASGLLVASGVAQADAPTLQAAKMSQAVAAVLAAAPLTAATPLAAFQQAAQAGFVPVNSSLTFGEPADMAAGWDGTLWAIDTAGAPHLYDPLNDNWQLHGGGVDGVARIGQQGPTLYFRGPQVFVSGGQGGLQSIAQLLPQLPPSYQLGVQGAAWAGGQLRLFRGGTYVSVPWPAPSAGVYHAAMQPAETPGPAPTVARSTTSTPTVSGTPTVHSTGTPGATGTPTATTTATPTANHTPTTEATPTLIGTATPPASGTPTRGLSASATYVANRLDTLPNWPQTSPWQDAVLDGVYAVDESTVLLIRGGEFLVVGFGTDSASVIAPPEPLRNWQDMSMLPADWLTDGFDGYVVLGELRVAHLLRGAQALTWNMSGPPPSPHYIATEEPDWPLTWNPILQQAPSGRSTGLWSVTPQGEVMSFDGAQWMQQPVSSVTNVGVGVDGAVFGVDWNDQTQLVQWNSGGWNQVATHSSFLAQVSVGNQGLVWTRDTGNAVHQLNQGQLQPVPVVGTATHLAASHDGTVWTCNGSDPVAARFASDLGVAPASVAAPGPVQKVASTGFGVAHCLVSSGQGTSVQRYQSPYVFRTAGSYTVADGDSIEQGMGSVYLNALIGGTGPSNPTTYFVAALDAHTGQELSRSALAPPGLQYTPPVFDAVHETVIVGLATSFGQESQPGQLLGLDARDLSKVRWSIALQYPNTTNLMPLGPGRLTLQGTQLCVSDNFNTLLMYDTGASLTAATPTLRWGYSFASSPNDDHRLPPPVLANGQVYAAWWLYAREFGFLQLWLWTLDAATGQGTQNVVDAQPGYRYQPEPNSSIWDVMGQVSPLLTTQPGAESGQTRQVLYVNGGSSVAGVDVTAKTVQYYDLPGSAAYASSGFGSANGLVWFGDNGTALHGIDGQLKAVASTPATLGDGSSGSFILTSPVPYTDSQGQTAILLGVFDEGASDPGLLAFDPTTGNVATIPTQGTTFVALAKTVSNGVMYAGGAFAGTTNTGGSAAQVFAIRVDAALQGLRDFVIDSQLMQDFDDPSQPTHNSNGVARYQTHLTLVDDQKAPMAGVAVKLWADQPNTLLLVNGQNYTIGPDDDQYAVVNTGPDGTLLIVSGYTQADGSDASDMSAPPLRAWASFMDPYERMLIYRDREFHNRVAAAHATSTGQSGADDPTRPNLQTAQKYGPLQKNVGNSGATLFTADEQQQGQPQQVASTIQKMAASVGTAAPSGSKTLKASFAQLGTDSPGKYVAYADTPSGQYSPVNVAANRAAVVLQPGGLSYSSNNDKSVPSAYSSMTPAEATLAIDALEGVPWHSSQYATPRVKDAAAKGTLSLGDALDDFWNWLKGAVATITHVIVSVAEDIYAGIRFIVDGVAHVFQAIITGIEQIASAIGSFFIELGKLIEEVIEALSVLFQFGHIIDTHNILKAELLNRINGVQGNSTYPGFAALVANNAVPQVDKFFQNTEQTISNALNGLANALGGAPVNKLPGSGSTVHSTFTVTPKGGGAPSNQSSQSTWALQKFNGGIGAGSVSAVRGLQASGDPVSAFFSGFIARLSGDGNLANEWQQIKSGAQQLGNSSSASDFLKQGLAELLRIVALLAEGVLAVSNAFVDGLLAEINALVQSMFGAGGFLTTELDIPVLSWLYQLLFGEPLTILNALMLVVAIPVTLLWRVIEGQWPSDSMAARSTARVGLGAAPQVVQNLFGLANAVLSVIQGILFGVGDAKGTGSVPLIIGRGALACSVAISGFSVPAISSDTSSFFDWTSWAVGLSMGLLNIFGSMNFDPGLSEELTAFVPAMLTALSIGQIFVLSIEFGVQPPPNVINQVALGVTMAALLPSLINPLKLASEIGAVVVAVLDVVMGLAVAVMGFAEVAASA